MRIPDLTYQYLRVQHGYVSHIADRKQFEEAYRKNVLMQYDTFMPYLPTRLNRVLDVGGGMSGIGLVIKARNGFDIHHAVVDGMCDPPIVEEHRKTFSNASALAEFYQANGAGPVEAISPTATDFGGPYDLVLSLAAWCFHIDPRVYLDRVNMAVTTGSVLVLDVRANRPDYKATLESAFGRGHLIFSLPKIERYVYTV